MTKKEYTNEVLGQLILGVNTAFYNLSAITQTESDQLTEKIKPNSWYPITQLLDIFSVLKKSNRNQPELLFKAGAAFIQMWYDNGGKELNHGSIGQMKYQDNSVGLDEVMRYFNPNEVYTKVLLLDEENGICQTEYAFPFPIDFIKGAVYNGRFMWGDLNWLSVEATELELFEFHSSYLITVNFQLKKSKELDKKTDDYIKKLNPRKVSEIDSEMALDLAWKVKGLRQRLSFESSINKATNKILGDSLEEQYRTSIELKKRIKNLAEGNKLIEYQKKIIEQSLVEKETLLKEIHHRVKNNLQLISGILELQAVKFDDKNVRTMMEEGQSRVRSMALIHQQLYQSDDLGKIDFWEYLNKLTNDIAIAFNNPEKEIEFKIKEKQFNLDINTAVPLGLIVNELITNAYKHAFKGRKKGCITIDLTSAKNEELKLWVIDDGIGLPKDFNSHNKSSLGLRLVQGLTRQIDGEYYYESNDGTQFEIQFKNTVFK